MAYDTKPFDFGEIMTVQDFRERVECRAFIDYDGSCHPIKDGLLDADIEIYPSMIELIPPDATHVQWYNR